MNLSRSTFCTVHMRGYLGVYLLQLLPFAVYFIILKEEKTNLIEYTKQADNEILEKSYNPVLYSFGKKNKRKYRKFDKAIKLFLGFSALLSFFEGKSEFCEILSPFMTFLNCDRIIKERACITPV